MTLFSDDRPSPLPATPTVAAPVDRRRRRGWTALAIGFVALAILALWPSSYVIQQPGPVYDTLGTAEHDDEQVPLITIDDTDTYETGGALDLLTVQVVGNPEQRANWFEVVTSWFNPSRTVVPVEQIFPPDQTIEQRNEQNAELMVDSQRDAVAAALSEVGYDVGAELTVGGIAEGAPAEGELEVDDIIVAVNGVAVSDVEDVRAEIAANGTERPAEIEVVRDGDSMVVDVTPVEAEASDGTRTPVVGITTRYTYDFPIDVTIQLDNVGGPSAGMMFALGIIDKLTPGELNGGRHIAGTGTITADGAVGPIGGIRQKLYGAHDAGVEVFLSPASNCTEVVGHVPDGLDVYSVETLDDALSVLEAVRDDSGLADLPTCEAAVAER